jgi:hypothetical protein
MSRSTMSCHVTILPGFLSEERYKLYKWTGTEAVKCKAPYLRGRQPLDSEGVRARVDCRVVPPWS